MKNASPSPCVFALFLLKKTVWSLMLLIIAPALLLAGDTLPEDNLEKALRIKYRLVLPKSDSLIDYSAVAYKKTFMIREKEALLKYEFFDTTKNVVVYYDLKSNIAYREMSFAPIKGSYLKSDWRPRGESLVESSATAAYTVAGKPCKASKVSFGRDTFRVLTTDVLGFDFEEFTGLKGIPMEYEFTVSDLPKLTYRAVHVDTVNLANGCLAVPSTFKVFDAPVFSENDRKRATKQQEYKERTKQKLIGSKAPSFKTKTLAGEKINSKQLKGKVLVLNFWFIGCRPCIEEIPKLNKIQNMYKDDENVVFLSLCRDNSTAIEGVLQRVSFDYEICPDASYIANQFRVMGYPVNIVIDRKGKIIKYLSGNGLSMARQLVDAIEQAKGS